MTKYHCYNLDFTSNQIYLIVTNRFSKFRSRVAKKYLGKIFVHFVHSTLRCLRQQIDKNSLENMEIWKFCSGNFNICEQARAPQGGKILKCGNIGCSRYKHRTCTNIKKTLRILRLKIQFLIVPGLFNLRKINHSHSHCDLTINVDDSCDVSSSFVCHHCSEALRQ